MLIGYVTVSNRVMIDDKSVGYLYREEPDDERDSGWRIFSGDESQEYTHDPANFAFYNASTIVEREPSVACLLGAPDPIAFERDSRTGEFVEIDEFDD